MNWLMRTINVARGLVAVDRQGFADGGSICFGVHATARGLSGLGEAGVAGAMDGMGAMGWVSASVPSLGERAEAGTAIAAKMAKIGQIFKMCRLDPGRLQNDKREAASSSRESIPSFMKNTRNNGWAVPTICRVGIRLELAGS